MLDGLGAGLDGRSSQNCPLQSTGVSISMCSVSGLDRRGLANRSKWGTPCDTHSKNAGT